MIKLDYRQFQCPHPVVETRKEILANPGQPLQVQLGDDMARENITRLATSQGYLVGTEATGNGYTLTLTPGQAAEKPETGSEIHGETVILCASDQMGQGSEDLGRVLLKNFFATLLETEHLPDKILFVNSGVKLACQTSEALEALTLLACRGVDIASCGLCLDYYELKDRLTVGRTTNMLEIAEVQLSAGRIIRP